MGTTLTQLITHTTFSTKQRIPFLKRRHDRKRVFQHIEGLMQQQGCPSIRVNGWEDHVHILHHLSRTESISKVLNVVKSASTQWVRTTIPNLSEFRWQRGYSSFSVDASNHDMLIRYIENQEAHHQQVDFKDEMRKFYALNKIAFDDQYVWD